MSNKSTYWVIFELIWRDFYRFFSLKHGSRIFLEGGTIGKRLMWNRDPEVWRRWRDGLTGLPLVDANMRELAATGVEDVWITVGWHQTRGMLTAAPGACWWQVCSEWVQGQGWAGPLDPACSLILRDVSPPESKITSSPRLPMQAS